ncbi:MAG: hypothetical protein ABEI52_04070 [Halobacteriaceae archaeon]
MARKTVKARGREGTSTKDLSIPAAVTREYDVQPGDVFTIDAETDDEGQLVLRYTRVFDGRD